MAKLKVKQETPAKKTRTIDFKVQAHENPLPTDGEKLVRFWEEEIGHLVQETFANEEEVVSAIVDRVIVRLETPENLVATTRTFLKDLFATDPALMAELRALVKIG